MKRYEYLIDLHKIARVDTAVPAHLTLRIPAPADAVGLADLMMDAYPGTIDFDGTETWDDAWREVDDFFQGKLGSPLLDCSRLVLVDGEIASACLVNMWDKQARPLLYSIMTAARWQGKGLANIALHHALQATAAAGYSDMVAFITDGNIPSEKLCTRAGFQRLTE